MLLLFVSHAAWTQTFVWNGNATNSWNNPTNWSPNGVPTANSRVVIPTNGVTRWPFLNSPTTIDELILGDNTELHPKGWDLTVNNTLDVGSGVAVGQSQEGGALWLNGYLKITKAIFDVACHFNLPFSALPHLIKHATFNQALVVNATASGASIVLAESAADTVTYNTRVTLNESATNPELQVRSAGVTNVGGKGETYQIGKVQFIHETTSPGVTRFVGSGQQQIETYYDYAPFHRLEMNQTGPRPSLKANKRIEIGKELLFKNGIIQTGQGIYTNTAEAALLVFNENATHSGASDRSYANRYVRKVFAVSESDFTFPVGGKGAYRPVGVRPQNVAVPEDQRTFDVWYIDTTHSHLQRDTAVLHRVSRTEGWFVGSRSGSSAVNAGVGFGFGPHQKGLLPYHTNESNLRVAVYTDEVGPAYSEGTWKEVVSASTGNAVATPANDTRTSGGNNVTFSRLGVFFALATLAAQGETIPEVCNQDQGTRAYAVASPRPDATYTWSFHNLSGARLISANPGSQADVSFEGAGPTEKEPPEGQITEGEIWVTESNPTLGYQRLAQVFPVKVVGNPVRIGTPLQDAYCHQADAVPLEGTPGGGRFSGPGVSEITPGSYQFSPVLAKVGIHTLTYAGPGLPATCNQATRVVQVEAPSAAFEASPEPNTVVDSIRFVPTDPDANAFYQWDFGDGRTSTGQEATHRYPSTGTYEVTLTVQRNGCLNTASRLFTVEEPSLLFVPNAFSPTASAPEDQLFRVYGNGISAADFELRIYNRWGKMIYETTSLAGLQANGWNGMHGRGVRAAQAGIYTYTLRGKFENGNPFRKVGTITLLE